jgi:hypothetical protein
VKTIEQLEICADQRLTNDRSEKLNTFVSSPIVAHNGIGYALNQSEIQSCPSKSGPF